MTKLRPFSFFALLLPLLLAGCGGGGGDAPASSQTTYLSPKTLIGGVMVVHYPDGRSYTFTINSTSANGVSRSDGKVSTNWIATGYNAGIMAFQVSFVAGFNPTDVNAKFDDYTLTFTSKTDGVAQIRENTSSASYSTTPILTGNFSFTTYPPNG